MLECVRNIELFWLLRKLQPNFRTIVLDFGHSTGIKNIPK